MAGRRERGAQHLWLTLELLLAQEFRGAAGRSPYTELTLKREGQEGPWSKAGDIPCMAVSSSM